MARVNFSGLLSLVTLFSLTAVASAVPLQIDFGTTDSPLQSGYSSFVRGTSPTNLATAQTEIYSGISISVAGSSGLACPNCGTGWRNRGAISGTFAGLSDLLGDEVKSNGVSTAVGDSLFLTLSGLTAGTWQITTYHHERALDNGTIDIYRVGNAVPLVTDLQQSFGTAPTSIATSTLSFFADGTNDVVFEYREKAVTDTGSEAVLNGLELELLEAYVAPPIPEPTSFSLLLPLMLGMIGSRRRWRRN